MSMVEAVYLVLVEYFHGHSACMVVCFAPNWLPGFGMYA